MKFKSFIFGLSSLLLMVGTASCDKQGGELDLGTAQKQSVSFAVNGKAATKATGSTGSFGESVVNKWCIFLLKDGQIIDRWYDLNVNDRPTTTLDPGTYATIGVANYPSSFNPATISSVAAINSSVSYLEDNDFGNFVMFSAEDEFEVGNQPVTQVVGMRRFVARVSIDQVAVDFSNRPDLASKQFVLKSIYLINVHGKDVFLEDINVEPASTPSEWYNKLRYSGEMTDFISDVNINASVTPNSPYQVAHYFYPYPNYTVMEAAGGNWSTRFTRLVVEGSIGTETRYYTINIAPVKRNCTYHITSIVIKGFGSGDPDDPTDTGEVEIEWGLDIQDWTHSYSVEEDNPMVDDQSNEGEDIGWDPDPEHW